MAVPLYKINRYYIDILDRLYDKLLEETTSAQDLEEVWRLLKKYNERKERINKTRATEASLDNTERGDMQWIRPNSVVIDDLAFME